ncbi:conserved hypothetical protein [Roseibium sp. TrichSKD4]|uniref:FkbM family methyltransferase n=1 Tax=Roseibium sp. TrichSKD4 TaxID=744980 RepID=UPI0001E57580|nr:FkbM family methyltransferase [Roseibium sp. TrichSKD4]EFO29981.1 conserved hypothetical protein [Roseibium sp. TrichSKD4]
MKDILKSALNNFGIGITRASKLEYLEANKKAITDIHFLKCVDEQFRSKCIDLLDVSQSEFRQDLFVLCQLNFKGNGYFVEFGATNGVDFSNTHLLETKFGWSGILAEPALTWHNDLKANRTSHVDTRCVWKETGQSILFKEAAVGELSTLDQFSSQGDNSRFRQSGGTSYEVETISLLDLLQAHNAPEHIEYLSLDTEGSEFEILSNFDFDRYSFDVITCEHNFTDDREKIHGLLVQHGYIRIFETMDIVDDWYVATRILN